MDADNLLLTQPVSSPEGLLENIRRMPVSDQKKLVEQCRKFESVFMEKLFKEVENSIGKWGMENDPGTKQIYGLFTTLLSRDISDKGGMGFWKEIYRSLAGSEPDYQQISQVLDSKI